MQQNVSLALSSLVKQGISLEGTRGGVVTPRDIVEGHREKTFGLLWKLILNWKVAVLVDLSVLEAEIAALQAEYKRIYGVDQPDRVVRLSPSILVSICAAFRTGGLGEIVLNQLCVFFSLIEHGIFHVGSVVGSSSLVPGNRSILQSLN